jgi:hypothetical protein
VKNLHRSSAAGAEFPPPSSCSVAE